MPDSFIFSLIAVVILGVALWQVFFSEKARAKREFKKAPLVTVKDAFRRKGVVRLQGRLRFDQPPLLGPISQRACAFYEVLVRERVRSGKSSHWSTVIDEKRGVNFWIEDATGRARVRPVFPRVILTMDANYSSGTFNDPSPELEAFLSDRGKSATGWVFNKTMEYKEGVLEEGEEVSAVGYCAVAERLDPFTGEMAKELTIDSGPDFKLILTDDYELAKYVGPQKKEDPTTYLHVQERERKESVAGRSEDTPPANDEYSRRYNEDEYR